MTDVLQNAAFGLSLLSVYLYGVKATYGAICGCVCAFAFILYGVYAGVPVAWATNVAFLVMHGNNLRKQTAYM